MQRPTDGHQRGMMMRVENIPSNANQHLCCWRCLLAKAFQSEGKGFLVLGSVTRFGITNFNR